MKLKKEEENKMPKTFTIQEESADEVGDHEQDLNDTKMDALLDRTDTDKQGTVVMNNMQRIESPPGFTETSFNLTPLDGPLNEGVVAFNEYMNSPSSPKSSQAQ